MSETLLFTSLNIFFDFGRFWDFRPYLVLDPFRSIAIRVRPALSEIGQIFHILVGLRAEKSAGLRPLVDAKYYLSPSKATFLRLNYNHFY